MLITIPDDTTPARRNATIDYADVIANTALCRDHLRLTLHVRGWSGAAPGQFVQLSPAPLSCNTAGIVEYVAAMPLLPRAFSIGALRPARAGHELDIIYRVVGVATRWMSSLSPGERATVLGPLGEKFPIESRKSAALLVIGGVGLPPLLFLAEALRRAGKRTVALLGAHSADLIPLTLNPDVHPARDAAHAALCTREFAALDVPMIISTDDGTLGYRGTVVDALAAYARAHPSAPGDTVVYTCGPERMMRATAEWCRVAGLACRVCMERPMACGLGTCQSCIVTVRSDAAAGGRRYALCCSEGPVFDAEEVVWDERPV